MSTGKWRASRLHIVTSNGSPAPTAVVLTFSSRALLLFYAASRRDDHSMMGEPEEGVRPRSWEVYASMPGIDSLFSGLSKRTPTGGFFTS